MSKPKDSVFFLLLSVLVVFVYQQALFVSFLSDDFSIIGKFLERHTPYVSFSDFFRPIPLINLWLDTQLFGLRPSLFRLENLLLHALNAFLVYRFALLILEGNSAEGHKTCAYLSGILFAVLPCHSEAVIWIACRPDLLATLFSLVCLICYLRWLRSGNRSSLYIASLAFLLAFLSKESAYALPLLLVVITLFHESPLQISRDIKKYRLAMGLFSGGLMIQFVLRYIATGELFGGAENAFTSLTVYAHTLFNYSYRTLLFPAASTMQADHIADNAPIISLLAITIIITGLRMTDTQSRKAAIFMLLAFVAALVPVIYKGEISLFELQIERYVYLPSVFACVFVPIFLNTTTSKRVPYFLFFIYAGAMIFFLNTSIERWNKASDIAVNSLQEVKEHFHSDKLIVISLPVAYKGVHIFKNGFPRAVMFFNKTPIRRKYIYTPVIIEINEDNLALNLTRNETGFEASIDSTESRLLPGENIGAYTLVADRENAVGVHYPDLNNSDYQLMLYCEEQLKFYANCNKSKN